MKHTYKALILLATVCLIVVSCKKEDSLKTSISGTTWWSEQTVSGGTMHTEFTFTGSSFSAVVTFPFTPSYPPSRMTGRYTYEYPAIYLDCPDFTDMGIMASDFKSFELGSSVFLRK